MKRLTSFITPYQIKTFWSLLDIKHEHNYEAEEKEQKRKTRKLLWLALEGDLSAVAYAFQEHSSVPRMPKLWWFF